MLAGNSSLESWKAQTCSKSKPRAATSDDNVDSGSSNSQQSLDMAEERSMIQRVPLTCIADTIVTLPKADDVPPGEMHCMHIEQPGHSWDEWPTNSLWGAIAGGLASCACNFLATEGHSLRQAAKAACHMDSFCEGKAYTAVIYLHLHMKCSAALGTLKSPPRLKAWP